MKLAQRSYPHEELHGTQGNIPIEIGLWWNPTGNVLHEDNFFAPANYSPL